MSDNDWLGIRTLGFVLASFIVLAILASAWRYERTVSIYQNYLKREAERQNREDALLARQEQLLERIEALVDQMAAEKGLAPSSRQGISERPTKS